MISEITDLTIRGLHERLNDGKDWYLGCPECGGRHPIEKVDFSVIIEHPECRFCGTTNIVTDDTGVFPHG